VTFSSKTPPDLDPKTLPTDNGNLAKDTWVCKNMSKKALELTPDIEGESNAQLILV